MVRNSLLSRMVSVALASVMLVSTLPAKAAATTATIDWHRERQEMDGFGISGAFKQAQNIKNLPQVERNKILDLLFSQNNGSGFSIVRNIVGDSADGQNPEWGNAIDGPTQSIQPKDEESWVWTGDEDQIWFMNEAKKRGTVRFMSTVWSPPAWMKTNNSTIGGYLKTDKYQAYAEYLAKYVKGYKEHHNIDIYAVSVQNEPEMTVPYSSCYWSGDQFRDFLKNNLKPTFAAQNIGAKVILGEQGHWAEDFLVPTLRDPVATAAFDIGASHAYQIKSGNLVGIAGAKKRLWQTEVSNMGDNDSSINDGLKWAKLLHAHVAQNDANAWFYWWGASYKTTKGESLICIDTNQGTWFTNKRLYTLGNYARFIRPGYVRIATTNPVEGVYLSSYKDPITNRFVTVAINDNNSDKAVQLKFKGFTTNGVEVYRTSSTEDLQRLEDMTVTNGALTTQLIGKSVTTFVGTGTSTTPQPLDGFSKIEAEDYDAYAGISVEKCAEGGLNVGYIQDGDWIAFKNVDFGAGSDTFKARVATSTQGGRIEIRKDNEQGLLLGTCEVGHTNGWQSWQTKTTGITEISSKQDIYLVFKGNENNLFNLNNIHFGIADNTTQELIDPMVDWSKTLSHSEGWKIDDYKPEFFENDSYRACRTSNSLQYIKYNVTNAKALEIIAYYNGDITDILVKASSTDSNYKAVTTAKSSPVDTNGFWKKVVVTVEQLPEGTNYLKIEVPTNSKAEWTPQIGQVKITN